jgi:hypothetical protein
MAAAPARKSTIGLGLAAIALGLLCWWLATREIDIRPISADPVAGGEQPTGLDGAALPLDGKPLAGLSETRTRPLLSTTRRPEHRVAEQPAPRPAAAPAPAVNIDGLKLVGLMANGAGQRRALVRTPADPNGTWLTEGAELDGFKLRSIREASIIVEAGGRPVEIAMQRPGKSAPASR